MNVVSYIEKAQIMKHVLLLTLLTSGKFTTGLPVNNNDEWVIIGTCRNYM
jgi:hypothetical protein